MCHKPGLRETLSPPLRKTCATRWLRNGVNLMDIKTWLGHKSLETTELYLSDTKHIGSEMQANIDKAGLIEVTQHPWRSASVPSGAYPEAPRGVYPKSVHVLLQDCIVATQFQRRQLP